MEETMEVEEWAAQQKSAVYIQSDQVNSVTVDGNIVLTHYDRGWSDVYHACNTYFILSA